MVGLLKEHAEDVKLVTVAIIRIGLAISKAFTTFEVAFMTSIALKVTSFVTTIPQHSRHLLRTIP